jgi:hypothetical protein
MECKKRSSLSKVAIRCFGIKGLMVAVVVAVAVVMAGRRERRSFATEVGGGK